MPGRLGAAGGSVEPALPVPRPSPSVLGQVEWERGALGGAGAVGELWFSPGPAPRQLRGVDTGLLEEGEGLGGPGGLLVCSSIPTLPSQTLFMSPPFQPSLCLLHPDPLFVSPLSQPSISPAEDTRPPGPATPRRSPSPKDPTEEEEEEEQSGLLMVSPNPWQETSLDRPYERAKNPSIDPEDGETQSSQCCLGSLVAAPGSSLAPGSPDPAGSPVSRSGDPPYRLVPIRSLVLCQQLGSSAPSTPEPSARQGQTPSLRYVLSMGRVELSPWEGGWE